jgi:hypothetical protein
LRAGPDREPDAVIERITRHVLDAIAVDTPVVDPAALRFLLRRYVATGDPRCADALGRALASAMDVPPERVENRPGSVLLYAEASAVSDDGRLAVAAARLVTLLRREWARETFVGRLMASVEACLAADACLAAAGLDAAEDLLPAAVRELERAVGAAYRPGAGVAPQIGPSSGEARTAADQIASASALLTAYARTGRLPYAMLAEELIHLARRTMWDAASGGFVAPGSVGGSDKTFALNCEGARVLCRLAALHADPAYREEAVVAAGADYAQDAQHALVSVAQSVDALGSEAALYGIALDEWLALAI